MTVGSRVRLRLATDDGLVALVRSGDTAAFEAIYERHSAALLSFCAYMLSSRQDAEDAIQATFSSAYRALQSNDRPVNLRPWLYAIARNESLSILRRRRPTVELNGEPALGGDPVRELEVREELRNMVEGLRELPELQRAALVLTEMHGLSQGEIGAVLGVRSEQVKAYVFQARSNLISDRSAREEDCREIREELASARGAALLRGRLRRHVRSCSDCQLYADGIARQRRQVAALLPVAPSLLLRSRVLGDLVGNGAADTATYAGGAVVGGSVADAALGLAGSGVKALAVKLATGVALVGLSAGVGASVLGVPIEAIGQGPSGSAAGQPAHGSMVAKVGRGGAFTRADTSTGSALPGRPSRGGASIEAGPDGSRGAVSLTAPGSGAQDQGVGPINPGASDPRHEGTSNSAGHGRKTEEERRRGQEERELAARERQHSREEREHTGQEHQRVREERESKGVSKPPMTKQERQHAREERESKGVSKPPKIQEERQHAREERESKGVSKPPKTKEERQHAREERESKGVSRPPKTREERQHAREQHQREREQGQ
jgi:RNA polymerase sigma factor (sigma-70 family)